MFSDHSVKSPSNYSSAKFYETEAGGLFIQKPAAVNVFSYRTVLKKYTAETKASRSRVLSQRAAKIKN